jgi:hypothetical protein
VLIADVYAALQHGLNWPSRLQRSVPITALCNAPLSAPTSPQNDIARRLIAMHLALLQDAMTVGNSHANGQAENWRWKPKGLMTDLVLITLLLVANGSFVAAEFALVKARGFRIYFTRGRRPLRRRSRTTCGLAPAMRATA